MLTRKIMQKQKNLIPHYWENKNKKQPQKDTFYYLELIKKALYIIWISSLSIGGLILFLYLASENIFPIGMSIEDYFLILFIAFTFGLVMLAGIAFGTTISYWIFFLIITFSIRSKKNRESPKKTNTLVALKSKFLATISIISAIAITLLILQIDIRKNLGLVTTIGYFFSMGIFLMAFLVKNSELIGKPQKIIFFCLAIFYMTITTKPMLLDLTTMATGIRSWPNQLITMTSEDKSKVLAIAKLHGLTVNFCETLQENLQGTIDLQIVWPGIGENSYVRLLEGNEPNKSTLLIPLSKNVEAHPSKNTEIKCPA